MKRQTLEVAIAAARRAGEYLLEASQSPLIEERIKESWHSIVTPHDLEAQRIILTALREGDENAVVWSEEGADGEGHEPVPPYWIVDPIDGTSYFARGLWTYSVSIAFVDEVGLSVGVVHCPGTNELFWAERGAGSFLGRRRIRVSTVGDPRRALFTFSHQFLSEMTPWRGRVEVVQTVRSMRGGGSCAQELAYLASGRIDGVVAPSQSPWDYAAGMLLVVEAGGEISDAVGRVPRLTGVSAEGQDIVATNGLLQRWCLERIGGGGR